MIPMYDELRGNLMAQATHFSVHDETSLLLLKAADAIEELSKRPEIPTTGIGDLSDGYHTFNGLYYQRMVLFAVLVKQNKDKAWKSWKHEDGEFCFGGGWFIVGIDTPQGSYTYHYEDKYWNWFECEELPVGKHWDGHTEEDVTRLLSLDVRLQDSIEEPMWIPVTERLPETHDYVLCCGAKGGMFVGYVSCFTEPQGFAWAWQHGGQGRKIKWWMPLPQPPQDGEHINQGHGDAER